MHEQKISRARFLAAAAAAGVAAATSANGAGAARPRGLTYRGVGYEVADGATPHTGWNAARMRADLGAIADELHASSVSVYGDGVERLARTAAQAADRGLHVSLQPRLADVPQREILDHLAETGRHAEQLRRDGADVELSVGAEFMLFVPGIVPGGDALERVDSLLTGRFDHARMQRRLDRFVAEAAAVGRSVFGGALTYGAAHDDRVDWSLFDVVSVNYYADFARRAAHVRALARHRRWGKPVAISEFGTCTYAGAPRRGGMGWNVVDYSTNPERIAARLVRSERSQAEYIARMLDLFESIGLHAATVYNFVTPDAPHRRDPRYDLDLASYAIVKPIWRTRERPTAGWHWERKEAFRAVARHYARFGV
ncbi:hypothetical protein [Conexibacter woesei]|uniref:Abortive infection protein n=1 Tax=Conexibacter woesei (strain DSM 14684 / CCUG 47730 / CIP 108061 / JCM 11494 / NBRC 100937 / ID131577) TaxID=469383 RepID=D3FCQ8_CONWI|nr:hypothetical protein [Conexibacter woesei]ADB49531.1 conserved hypothetical protein [Conexibacter woesei DSM 14684]